MRKTKYKILFALMGFGLFSFTSCLKKESVQLSVNPGIRELSGVPAFADTLLRNSNFNIETQKFGVLHFELEHQKMSTFNGKRNLFMGKVSSAKTGATGTAYLFSGTGGVQIGFTLYSSVSKAYHRLQIRNFKGMYEVVQLNNLDGKTSTIRANSISITEEMRDKGILPEFKDSIVLESGNQYELVDLNAFDEYWLKSNPNNKRGTCGDLDIQNNQQSNIKRAGKLSQLHYAFHVINGNPFGIYSYNRTVDDYTSIYAVIHGIDYNNLIPIKATLTYFNGSNLAWSSDYVEFMQNWASFYSSYLRTNSAAESCRLNLLGTGNGWNAAVGAVYTYYCMVNYWYNVGYISTQPGVSPFTASHEASHALGANHDATVRYPYCGWWYQDLMRDNNNNPMVYCVNWHANGNNINNIRSCMQGY